MATLKEQQPKKNRLRYVVSGRCESLRLQLD